MNALPREPASCDVLGRQVAAGGLLAQVLGLSAVFVIMGLLTLALVTGMTKVTDEVMDAAERDADHS